MDRSRSGLFLMPFDEALNHIANAPLFCLRGGRRSRIWAKSNYEGACHLMK
jgi:hypothetical protein